MRQLKKAKLKKQSLLPCFYISVFTTAMFFFADMRIHAVFGITVVSRMGNLEIDITFYYGTITLSDFRNCEFHTKFLP